MTIQRVTFECRGQDFHWWEIDDTTGRIVGCGPHGASTWASGRCSVNMATVRVGQRPTFHGPATEPEGRTLSWEIVALAPADIGGGVASMTELSAALVDAVAAAVAAADWTIGKQHSAGYDISLQLEIAHGARIVPGRDPMTMSMAGVRASSTGGFPGLFGNWVAAARRRLASAEGH